MRPGSSAVMLLHCSPSFEHPLRFPGGISRWFPFPLDTHFREVVGNGIQTTRIQRQIQRFIISSKLERFFFLFPPVIELENFMIFFCLNEKEIRQQEFFIKAQMNLEWWKNTF